MKRYFTVNKVPIFLEFILTMSLIIYVQDFSKINSFSTLVVLLLEIIIVLELIRMLMGFLFGDDHRVKLRYMIDSTIVFFIRDIMLIVNDKFDMGKIGSILGIIAVLFLFRFVTMRFSPSVIDPVTGKKKPLDASDVE